MYTWQAVADTCEKYFCFERQRTGTCSCRGDIPGRRKPTCYIGRQIISSCNSTEPNLEMIGRFLAQHTCGQFKHNQTCRHHTCSIHYRMLQWIKTQETLLV